MSLISDLDDFFEKDKFEDKISAENSFKIMKLYVGALKKFSQSSLETYRDWKKWFNFGLNINGRDLQYVDRRGFMVTKDGYKNMVISKYPNAKLDIQIVYKGDTLTYERNDNGVKYNYVCANPFDKKEVVGAFGFINTNDESNTQIFETLNVDEIEKMKSTANTDMIWKKWFDEMVRKSMIKRVCKRLFNDDKLEEAVEYDNEKFGTDLELSDNQMETLAKKMAQNYKENQLESL